jgi:large subunit ribosomal protein L13
MQRQTTMIKPDQIERKWYVIDAKGKTLGRLASQVSQILIGKNKPFYTPHLDCGDYVIIINAKEVVLNGNNKLDQKMYYNVSGYLGGLRQRSARTMIDRYPIELIERVVWGMLPKGRLGRKIYKKLFVYEGNEHKHAAQNPQVLDIE